MPKCVLCTNLFHSDFGEEFEPGKFKCYFCKNGSDFLTLVDKQGRERKVTKKEANEGYMRKLRELSEKPNIKKILDTSGADTIKEGSNG